MRIVEHHRCHECRREDLPAVVELTDDGPDYEDNTIYLCRDCVAAAVALFDGPAARGAGGPRPVQTVVVTKVG